MAIARDSQFSEWAKLLWDELETAIRQDPGFIPEGDTRREIFLPAMQKIIARREYDLACFIIKQVYRGESGPKEILCIDGEPVTILPENLAEWYKKAPFLVSYDGLPDEVKTWVEQDLGWKRDEVTSVDVENLSALRGAPCTLISITMFRGKEAKSQEFIREKNGWQLVKEEYGQAKEAARQAN